MSAATCSLTRGIRIERGERADWLVLAPLHYRSHNAGAVTDIFRLVYGEPSRKGAPVALPPPARQGVAVASPVYSPWAECGTRERLVGVIVYSRSPLSLAARDRATAGRYRLARCGRVATASLINQELRIISRVVVAPNWRGLGLASRLVAETLPRVGTPYVEALAAMGEMHPLFVRAGMTAYPQGPSKEGERLAAALEAAGLARADRRSADRLAAALDALGPAVRALAEREIARWARSYLGAKNHRTNRPDRRRMLELVARHLDSRPVYYLWRAADDGVGRGKAPATL
jgi:GNAT superfamily N-acetyltransferase